MQVAILGELEVRAADGSLRPVAGGRVRALLARLALDVGRVVPAHVLVDEVWNGDPPAEPANALQSLVSRLRRTLGDGSLVVQEAGGYRLALARADVDVTRLADLLADVARTDDLGRRETLLQQATDIARGPAAPDLDSSHALRIEELVLGAHEQRLDLDLERGVVDPADLARRAAALARANPLHEHLTAQLMTALRRQGRTADALTAYEQLRVRLADELGADPSGELQTLHLELLQEAPVVTPRPTRRTNLRAGVTSFLGRDDEAKRLHTLLERGRLATIVGPGGAGKTRLSGVVAAEWVDRMADGVWFVELAPVTDPASLPQALLGSLGVQVRDVLDRRGDRGGLLPTLDRLIDVLAEAECLLVVDNCEHLVAGVAELVDTLLAECPGLRVLATSREPLGIDGEALCLLPPLLLPARDADPVTALEHASVALFADRARSVDAGFAVDATTVRDVVDIVRRLDGLPLAIELAAARLRVLPVTEVAARLGDRFRLLTGGSRTAMPRHRTLRAVVEWSWDLLSDDERTLAERLAVFPGGATLDSAAAVGVTAGLGAAEVADLLDALVDKSLLRVEAADGLRYRMLETIREYGIERLVAQGVVDDVRRAHALHHAALVREAGPHLRTSEQLTWLRRVDIENDNIIAALQFLVHSGEMDVAVPLVAELALYWTLVGLHAEAATWLEFTLAVPGGPEQDRLVGHAMLAINSLAGGPGADPPAEPEADAQLSGLDDVGRRIDAGGLDGSSQALVLLRPMLAFFGDEPGALRQLMERSLAVADPWTTAALLMFRANLAENEGDLVEMRRDTATALGMFERLGERWGMASCLTASAQLAKLDGDLDRALSEYGRAQRYLSEFGAVGDLVFTRARIAELHLRRGNRAGAEREWDAMASVATSRAERMLTDAVRAGILRLEGDAAGLRVQRERLLDHVDRIGLLHPLNGHMAAVTLSAIVGIDLWLTDGPVPADVLIRAYELAVGTRDMPIVATYGQIVPAWLERLGLPAEAAKALGATAAVLGQLDDSDPEIAALAARLRAACGDDAFDAAYRRGSELTRDEAVAALDPRPFVTAAVATPVTGP